MTKYWVTVEVEAPDEIQASRKVKPDEDTAPPLLIQRIERRIP